MTRINVIPVEMLCRQHLLAEHFEIEDVFKLVRRHVKTGRTLADVKSRIPPKYVLGIGHVSFFIDKLTYCNVRHTEIKVEMSNRGYNVSSWATLREQYPEIGLEWYGDYTPDLTAKLLNEQRIQERMKSMKERGIA